MDLFLVCNCCILDTFMNNLASFYRRQRLSSIQTIFILYLLYGIHMLEARDIKDPYLIVPAFKELSELWERQEDQCINPLHMTFTWQLRALVTVL